MIQAEFDLGYLREAVDNFKNYLFSDEIFWTIPSQPKFGSPYYPALTLGGVLFSLKRLDTRMLLPNESTEYAQLVGRYQVLKTNWRSAWERKAARSFQARLIQWKNFINEYRKKPDTEADRYKNEIRIRVLLGLLLGELPEIDPGAEELIKGLDQFLRVKLIQSAFIWDESIQLCFPEEEYWYLYGYLPEN